MLFGVEMDRKEASLAQSVIDLLNTGNNSAASDVIRKMGQLGYTRGLTAVHKELSGTIFTSFANYALEQIK